MQSFRKRWIGRYRLLVFSQRALVLALGKKIERGIVMVLRFLALVFRHEQTGF